VIPRKELRQFKTKGPKPTNFKHSCHHCEDLPPGSKCPVGDRDERPSEPHDPTGSTISLGSNIVTTFLGPDNVERFANERPHAHEEQDIDNLDLLNSDQLYYPHDEGMVRPDPSIRGDTSSEAYNSNADDFEVIQPSDGEESWTQVSEDDSDNASQSDDGESSPAPRRTGGPDLPGSRRSQGRK